jgi:AcrR family transcriptional regulator
MNERSFIHRGSSEVVMAATSPGAGAQSARRDQILAAATSMFAEKGYSRATMKAIALRAGLAPGTIYLYFASKRDLILALVDRLVSQAMNQTLAQYAHLDAREYFRAILRDRLAFVRQHRALLQALIAEVWVDQELQAELGTRVLEPLFGTAGLYLSARVAEGTLRPCRVEVVLPAISSAVLLLSVLRGLPEHGLLPDIDEDQIIDELAQLYMYGLAPASGGSA